MTGTLRRVNLLGSLTMGVVIGLWELLVRTGGIDFEFLPAPSAIAGGAQDLLSSGDLMSNVAHTVRVTLIGWLLASALGTGLGLLLGLSETAWRWSMASIEVMRAIPPVSLVPVALLVFGFSMRMELMIILFVSAWPVLVNTIDASPAGEGSPPAPFASEVLVVWRSGIDVGDRSSVARDPGSVRPSTVGATDVGILHRAVPTAARSHQLRPGGSSHP